MDRRRRIDAQPAQQRVFVRKEHVETLARIQVGATASAHRYGTNSAQKQESEEINWKIR